MGAVAFVSFEGFYTACLARKEPEWARRPVAVFRAGKVLDASAQARRLQIHPGMAASEARYATKGAGVRFVAYEELDYAQESRSWLDVCCGYTTVIEPIDPHCAFLDLSGLAGARELATPLAADLYQSVRLCPRIGIANGKLSARLSREVLADGDDASFLAPLPLSSLWPAKAEHLRRLSFLGYRTIGDVAKLPLELLQKHFGQEGLQLSLWARGRDRTPVRALYPRDELSSRFDFPQPARSDAEIEAGLQVLASRLGKILQMRDMQTSEIELQVVFEDSNVLNARRPFVKPMQSPGALLTGLRLTLRMIPLCAEVHSIYARFPSIEKSTRKQLALPVEKDKSAVESTVKKLQETFGKEAVKRADDIVLPRRQHVLRSYAHPE